MARAENTSQLFCAQVGVVMMGYATLPPSYGLHFIFYGSYKSYGSQKNPDSRLRFPIHPADRAPCT